MEGGGQGRSAWQAYTDGLGGAQRAFGRKLGSVAAFSYRRPWTTIAAGLISALVLAVGFLRLEIVTESEKLWTPQGSKSMEHRDYAEARFSGGGSRLVLQVEPASGSNVVTVPVLSDLFRAASAVLDAVDAQGRSFTDVCEPTATGCDRGGLLAPWGFDRAQLENDAATNDPTAALLARINAATFPSGRRNEPTTYLSPVDRDASGGVTGAATGLTTFRLRQALTDSSSKTFMEAADAALDRVRGTLTAVKLTWVHEFSIDDEVEATVSGDIVLVITSFVTMTLFASLSLSNVRNFVKSRIALALGGVVTTAVSMAAGYGFCALVGIKFSTLQAMLPFLLVGIGLDDMFVLVNGLDVVRVRHPSASAEELFRLNAETFGTSITVTSLTNILGFALGTATVIPAVRWFCAYAAVAIAFDWALQLTLFTAMMAVDDRRRAASRCDLLCCVKRAAPSSSQPAAATANVTAVLAAPDARASKDDAGGAKVSPRLPGSPSVDATSSEADREAHPVQFYIRRVHVPLVTSLWGQIPVLLVLLALAACGIYGATQLDQGLPLKDLARTGTTTRRFFEVQESSFDVTVGSAAKLYWRNVDFSAPAAQAGVLETFQRALEHEWADPDANGNAKPWVAELVTFAKARGAATELALPEGTFEGSSTAPVQREVIAQAAFEGELAAFIGTPDAPGPGKRFVEDLVFAPGFANGAAWASETNPDPEIVDSGLVGGPVVAARASYTFAPVGEDVSREIDLFHSVRELSRKLNAVMGGTGDDDRAFVFMLDFIFTESDLVLWDMTLLTMGLGLVGVFVVSLLFLVHPVSALLCTSVVFLIDCALLAAIWWGGMRFNTVSSINLILGLGLSVDMTLHIAHKFLEQPFGDRKARVAATLNEIGFAVALAGLSTFLGILPLAASRSTIFLTFFKLISATLGFGLYGGLFLLPGLLCWLGPSPILAEAHGGAEKAQVAALKDASP
ncbi:unnamed protein product [Pedinophyceae sp. YPF-701]|nr:unnamed protein product [Pedinophyceae sp. YPF-701]